MTLMSGAAEKSARLIAVLLLGVVQAGVPGPLLAQASGACDRAPFRDFDYWRGTWAVENVDGERIGTNTISSVSEGCALLEQWESVKGPAGMSVNYYDPSRERWEQVWVGGGGLILRLAGELEGDVMVLTSTEPRETPRGAVLDRISWIPEGEAVRQLWEISLDDGETWETAFEGIYRRGEPASGQADAAGAGDESAQGIRICGSDGPAHITRAIGRKAIAAYARTRSPVGHERDAEEVVQEAWLRAAEGLRGGRTPQGELRDPLPFRGRRLS